MARCPEKEKKKETRKGGPRRKGPSKAIVLFEPSATNGGGFCSFNADAESRQKSDIPSGAPSKCRFERSSSHAGGYRKTGKIKKRDGSFVVISLVRSCCCVLCS